MDSNNSSNNVTNTNTNTNTNTTQHPINNNVNNNVNNNYTMRGSINNNNEAKVNPNQFRSNIINPKEIKPALSMTKFRVIAGVLGSIAFYITCVSEFGDYDNKKKTVTTEFRKKHDQVLSDLLGFDVREKIRNLEKGFFQLRDGMGKKVDSIDTTTTTIDNGGVPQIVEKEKEKEKSNLFLNAATGGKYDTTVQPTIQYDTEMERINALIESNKKQSLKLEQLVEKQFQDILDKSYGSNDKPSSSSSNK